MHPVLKIIEERKKSGSRAGKREDPFKVGLAIEGGGMRGIVSAGMVTALEYLGYLDTFDAVYGTSAGAINGAYFVAGQAHCGTTIYFQNINNDKFIDFRRLLTSKPVMSLEFLLGRVMVKEKVLDWKAVIDSHVPLKVIATSLGRLRPVILPPSDSREDLFEAFRASARIPLIAGGPVSRDGDRYLDGGIIEAIPYKTAVEDGCTHVLALPTRPEEPVRIKPSLLEKTLVRRYLRRIDPALAEALRDRPRQYAKMIEELEDYRKDPKEPPYVYSIALPSGSRPVRRSEKRSGNLIYGANKGVEAVAEALLKDKSRLGELIHPFNESGCHPDLITVRDSS